MLLNKGFERNGKKQGEKKPASFERPGICNYVKKRQIKYHSRIETRDMGIGRKEKRRTKGVSDLFITVFTPVPFTFLSVCKISILYVVLVVRT